MPWWEDEGPYFTYAEALAADMRDRSYRYEKVKELPKFLKDAIAQLKKDSEPKPSEWRYRHLQAELSAHVRSILVNAERALPDEAIIDHVYWPNEPKAMTAHRVRIVPTARATRAVDVVPGMITDITFAAKFFGEKHAHEYVLSLYPGYIRPVIRSLSDFKVQRKLTEHLKVRADA